MSFNFMAAVTICSDFGAQKIKCSVVTENYDYFLSPSAFIFTKYLSPFWEGGINIKKIKILAIVASPSLEDPDSPSLNASWGCKVAQFWELMRSHDYLF